VDAARDFPDEFFSFVYLDARHDEESVREDLLAWYPKLRVGGLFSGHDYVDLDTALNDFGVKTAVDEFARYVHKGVFQTNETLLPSWYWIK